MITLAVECDLLQDLATEGASCRVHRRVSVEGQAACSSHVLVRQPSTTSNAKEEPRLIRRGSAFLGVALTLGSSPYPAALS